MIRAVSIALLCAAPVSAQPKLPPGLVVEERPKDPKAVKIVLIAGSNFFKAGEHDYIAGCGTLADLLRQTPHVAPVLAVDWPTKPETFAGAKAVIFFTDGAEKHEALKGNRLAEVQKLADAGAGLVFLHQTVDVPKDLGDRMRGLAGAAWEKGYSQRAHWVAEFKQFPGHPICRGVTPFTIDDGWLYQLRFADGKTGVTPLVRTVNPRGGKAGDEAIVGWAFERPGGTGAKPGRSFAFTGCHLHASFAQEGYRRFLVNGILWSAGVEVPAGGAPAALAEADLKKYLAVPKR
jgi:hypothetical protein